LSSAWVEAADAAAGGDAWGAAAGVGVVRGERERARLDLLRGMARTPEMYSEHTLSITTKPSGQKREKSGLAGKLGWFEAGKDGRKVFHGEAEGPREPGRRQIVKVTFFRSPVGADLAAISCHDVGEN
jgi:hypothetical protein